MVSPLILRKCPSAPLNSTWNVLTHLEGEEPVRPVRLHPPSPAPYLDCTLMSDHTNRT